MVYRLPQEISARLAACERGILPSRHVVMIGSLKAARSDFLWGWNMWIDDKPLGWISDEYLANKGLTIEQYLESFR